MVIILEISKEFENKKGKRVFITANSPPKFTLNNYKEVLLNEGVRSSIY